MNPFVIADPKNCIGCRTCEIACVIAHNDVKNYSDLSDVKFVPRIRVIKNDTVSTALLCRHCEDAPCAEVCPNDAIVRENNTIQVKQEKCIGCKTCALACPYGVMQIVTTKELVLSPYGIYHEEVKAQAIKCDLCIDRDGGPSCVEVCPTDALHLVTADSLDDLMRKRREAAALGRVDL